MPAVNTKHVDHTRYGRLLARTVPAVVHTEKENERLLAEIEKLMKKGEANLAVEEGALLDLLVGLVENYESRAYQTRDALPHELLAFLMQQHGLTQSALAQRLGCTKGRVSEILSGKREVSKEHAKRLGMIFHVSPAAFI